MTATAATAVRKQTILRIENVSLSLSGKQILRGVDAHIEDLVRPNCVTGQVVAFLGPSGIGKTSLLRIMAGLQKPTSGAVLIGDSKIPVRAGMVGLVDQQAHVYRNRTVLGNLVIAAQMAGDQPPKQIARRRAVEMLDRFGLLDHGAAYPACLSGGQRQRVAIAQQLLSSEHFLLMDEPTAGLDPLSKRMVCDLIAEVANRDELNTVILVTHDIPTAVAVADTIWLMGRDRNEHNEIVPGAKIVKTFDLIERGLCWQPDVRKMPEYAETVLEIQDWFEKL